MSVSSGSNTKKILLIGDVSGAFLDVGSISEQGWEVCRNVADGVEAASKDSFAAIGVVMAGLSSNLGFTLTSLRRADAGAKIILLSQMLEEPIAIQFIESASNIAAAADDYLICPLRTERLYKYIMSPQEKTLGSAMTQAAVDTAIERKIRHLEKLATEDDLTGLKNRRYIREFSRQIIEHASRDNGRVTLLIFDIDNFKHYNDVYGHTAGDEILRQAAVLMRRCCRGHDVVGRIGGDEFAVVFWDEPPARLTEKSTEGSERRSSMAQHPKEVISVAKRFQSELEKAEFGLLGPAGKGVLTISGGLASLGDGCSSVKELFEQADKALLAAKHSGKNRIYLVGRPDGNIADVR